MKRWRGAAIVFCCIFLCLLLTGCSQQTGEVKPQVSLTALQYELENIDIDFQNLWFYQELEDRTGVSVRFEDVKDSEWNSRVSLAFSGGQLPDLIMRGSLDIEEYGVHRGELIPLDGYIERGLMPNYASRLGESGIRQQLTASDGHMYSVGFLISQGINTNGHFFIRQDWLDRLSLQVPETTEALYQVLRAFRDQDPNGNGVQDEIPLELTWDDNNTGIYNLFSFWGLPLNEEYVYLTPEGEARFAPLQPEFLEAARELHTWYTEGLLDAECISQGSNIWAAKVNQGNCGMFSYWRLQNTALASDLAREYRIMLPPHAEQTQACLPRNMDIIEFGAAITKSCRDVESALKWLDEQFETETMLVSQNGKVGDTLTRREDGRYEVQYVPEGNELYHEVPVICGQFFAPPKYYDSVYVPAAHRLEKKAYCEYYEKAGVLEKVSFKRMTVTSPKTRDEDARLTALKAVLKNEIDASLVRFVTRGVTETEAEEFQERLKALGAEEYTELYQTVYDRTEGV